MSHIISLASENVKRLKAVRITPKGAMQVISGRNGEGKSSVLDSILYALCGEKTFPLKPVREGEERADIEIVLDSGHVIKRYMTAAGTSGITVKAKDGATYPSPQKMLDELTGKLTFDPLAFLRLDPEKQAATLRKLVGLDTSATDAEIKRVYDERTVVNKRLVEMRGAVSQMAQYPDAPATEVSSTDILAAIEKAQAHNQQGVILSQAVERAAIAATQSNELVKSIRQDIVDLEAKLASAKAALTKAETNESANDKALAKAKTEQGAFTAIDTAPLSAQLKTCEATNAKVRANAQRAKAVAEGQAKKAESDKLTARLEELEKEKADALAAVKFPVEGLALDGDVLTFNGIPLSQVNSAQQIRVGVAISAALSPKLKVILIRNGNDLDDSGLAELAKMAEEMGLQVWLERIVADGNAAVVIEDGEVVGAEPIVEAPKAARKTRTPKVTPDVTPEGTKSAPSEALGQAPSATFIDPGF